MSERWQRVKKKTKVLAQVKHVWVSWKEEAKKKKATTWVHEWLGEGSCESSVTVEF